MTKTWLSYQEQVDQIAHHARIWNHSVLDARSVYEVLVALDGMLATPKAGMAWLDPLLDQTTLLTRGLRSPAKYGQMGLG